jgi:predicted peptidase
MSFKGNRRTFCALAAYAFLSALPAGAAAQVPGNLPVLAPGMHHLTFARAGEPTVGYTISIPADYSPTSSVPLVLALHFGVGGGSATGAGGDLVEILVGPALEGLGAIIVAPDSVKGNWSTPENEKAVSALLDAVIASYAIDTKKIVVTGYSMGGAGAWHFAEKFPERFRAAIPVSGTPPESAAGWRLPVLAIHSHDDQVQPFAPTQARIAELEKAGVKAKLIPLQGITHYQMDRFQGALRQAVPWLREVWK